MTTKAFTNWTALHIAKIATVSVLVFLSVFMVFSALTAMRYDTAAIIVSVAVLSVTAAVVYRRRDAILRPAAE